MRYWDWVFIKEATKFLLALVGGVFVFMFVLWILVGDKRSEAEKEWARTPRVIREFDGCKTYQFEEGGAQHYITRCPNSTVTHEKDWYEREGKVTVLKQESNVTTEQ